MAAAYAASGLSMRAFGIKHGLGKQRVSYWVSKATAVASSGRRRGGFATVQVAAETAPPPGDRSVEVRLRNGRSLVMRGHWDEGAVRTWLSALESVA